MGGACGTMSGFAAGFGRAFIGLQPTTSLISSDLRGFIISRPVLEKTPVAAEVSSEQSGAPSFTMFSRRAGRYFVTCSNARFVLASAFGYAFLKSSNECFLPEFSWYMCVTSVMRSAHSLRICGIWFGFFGVGKMCRTAGVALVCCHMAAAAWRAAARPGVKATAMVASGSRFPHRAARADARARGRAPNTLRGAQILTYSHSVCRTTTTVRGRSC